MTPDDERHGTTRGYHAGCRDKCCRAAIARYEKAGRLARLSGGRAVPAQGAQRRLQALMRLGWSSHAIANEAGLNHRNHVWRIVNGQKGRPTTWIQKETDQWVRDVYDKLSMRLPSGRYVTRTRAHAERNGWPPPLAWDDIDNDPTPMTACSHGNCLNKVVTRGMCDTHNRAIPAHQRTAWHDDIDPVVVARILAGEYTLKATRAEKEAVVAAWPGSLAELSRLTGWHEGRYTTRRDGAA